MLGVLIVILRSDGVADLSFGAGERQIPLIFFLRVVGIPRTGTGAILCPPIRTPGG
jgi:hypothetical protein